MGGASGIIVPAKKRALRLHEVYCTVHYSSHVQTAICVWSGHPKFTIHFLSAQHPLGTSFPRINLSGLPSMFLSLHTISMGLASGTRPPTVTTAILLSAIELHILMYKWYIYKYVYFFHQLEGQLARAEHIMHTEFARNPILASTITWLIPWPDADASAGTWAHDPTISGPFPLFIPLGPRLWRMARTLASALAATSTALSS